MIWGIIFDLISRFFFPGLGVSDIEPKKSDYPDRPKNEAFSPKADEVISTPSKLATKPASLSATAKRDNEFWETL
jgi:hypothetical protein